ncbi:putative toxin-antitoxin system toxin component, PIN family [uncultured Lamprocystis sp.]|uniref:putative toxin-antitoxin system toxin component, PIN family n=1 Tax=uncultured Lamprocystis sp. TaxID=543132 RepID=UPI0026013FEA|nr:putative toxin-antitoxin system toxin component, PIN family [uncultured Lamprocystis sp.]
MRAIVDTNILISGLLSKAGVPGKIVDAIVAGRITAVFSSETLAELRDVLTRPRLQPYLTRAKVDPVAKDFTAGRYGEVPVVTAADLARSLG